PEGCRPFGFKKKYCDVHCFRRIDGFVGSIYGACYDARPLARALQRGGVLDARSPALMLHLEYLFHEAPAGWRAGKPARFFSRADVSTSSWFARRTHLGRRYGFQSSCSELDGGSHFLCDRAVGTDGRSSLGNSCVERI